MIWEKKARKEHQELFSSIQGLNVIATKNMPPLGVVCPLMVEHPSLTRTAVGSTNGDFEIPGCTRIQAGSVIVATMYAIL